MNMIEKAARALCVASGRDPDKLEPGDCVGTWEGEDGVMPNGDVAHWIWRESVDKARMVIEAFLDPTDGMTRDGWHELRKHNEIQTRLGNSLVGVETPVFRAMVLAALDGK
jgi:hypothetical protein